MGEQPRADLNLSEKRPEAARGATGNGSDDATERKHGTSNRSLRWSVYGVLIAVAVGNMSGRLLAVNSVDNVRLESHRIRERLTQQRERLVEEGLAGDELEGALAKYEQRLQQKLRLQRPFLSSNDRSRWLTIRSLVEYGTYEIDAVTDEPTWDTIDMVQHEGRDGEPHLYSSKPPLLATLLAGEYWLIHRLTGATLATHPYTIGRFMLMTINVLPLALLFILMGAIVERCGETDWGRIFVMAATTLGTQLNTFAVVLNNHTVAAVSAGISLYALVRIARDKERRPWLFVLAGLATAFVAAIDLPALSLVGLVGVWLLLLAPRETLIYSTPAVLVVAATFFGTNYIAHASWRPPYAHRSETDPQDNWYEYTFERNGRVRQSYWSMPSGIDQGEPRRDVYALHVLIGHHGVFSLTPVWLLSAVGAWQWLRRGGSPHRELALLVAALTVVCLTFYIGFRPQEDRNYGGMTSGFRWMFWFVPLWLLVMLPAADRLAGSRFGQSLALVLLAFSVLSAAYPTWNPWTQPWIYDWMQHCGWEGFG